jgi:hypothetical protein
MLTSQLTPREGLEEKEARTALAARESPIQRERRERAKGTPQSMFEHRDDVNPSSPPNVRMGARSHSEQTERVRFHSAVTAGAGAT